MRLNECIDRFTNNISNAFNDIVKEKNRYLDNKIVRKINPSMSNVCENEVALLAREILCDKYKYLVDCYLPYKIKDKNSKKDIGNFRPDVVIIKRINGKNTIVGIIEVKAQMGYSGVLDIEKYDEKVNGLKYFERVNIKFDENEYEILAKNKKVKDFYLQEYNMGKDNRVIELEVSKNFHYFIVNVLASNHYQNVIGTIKKIDGGKYPDIHFYSLFGGCKDTANELWYNNLHELKYQLFGYDTDDENIKKHDFEHFYFELKEIVGNTK